MNAILQQDSDNFQRILSETLRVASGYLDRMEADPPARYVEHRPLADLPTKGIGAEQVLSLLQATFGGQFANSKGPRYFGFVTGGVTPAALAGDWLVSALDQNVGDIHESVAGQIELQTIHYLKQLFGLDTAYFGTFVTGATMSNFVSLATARQWVGHQYGTNVSFQGLAGLRPVRVLSGTPHASILKSLAMLGIGRDAVVKLDVLPDREAVEVDVLEQYLAGHPGEYPIVVANAGTVNTVDFDDLARIGALKEKYPFWLHIDAAFGGFAACSEQYAHYLTGIQHADSITIDAHKWLNVPYDAAMQFTRHPHIQAEVLHNQSAYLGDPDAALNFIHYTPENSRRFRALPAWFTLLAYGCEGYQEVVERNCRLAHQLGEWLSTTVAFSLLAPVRMNVVCFTLNREGVTAQIINNFLANIRADGRIFLTPTVYKGVPAIRAAISNWQTEERDIQIACQALAEVYESFAAVQEAVLNQVEGQDLL